MKEILALLLAAGASLLLAVATAVASVLRRTRGLALLAALALVAGIGLAGRAGYIVLHKAKNRATHAFRPRTGAEIYRALFGQGVGCSRVLQAQDQVVPKIDYAIWLHFKTCPQELRRLLTRHQFSRKKETPTDWLGDIPSVGGDKWWRPQTMGDTIIVYEYTSENRRNIQTLFASRDSTEVFCRDMLD